MVREGHIRKNAQNAHGNIIATQHDGLLRSDLVSPGWHGHGGGWRIERGSICVVSVVLTRRVGIHVARGLAVTSETKRIAGLVMAIVGLALLVLNAADYVLGWDEVSSPMPLIGIIFVVVGVGLWRVTRS